MRRRQIVRMVKEIWFPELKNRGFTDNKGEYIRRLDSGVVHLIGIGKDPPRRCDLRRHVRRGCGST